jgi:hypothetical protein
VPGTDPAIDPHLPSPPSTRSVTKEKPDDTNATRQQLADAAGQLGTLLDESWRQYLALPKVVFSGSGVPTVESLEQALARYERVTKDERYRVLLERDEFQRALNLLRTYTQQVRVAGRPVTASPYGASVRQSIR